MMILARPPLQVKYLIIRGGENSSYNDCSLSLSLVPLLPPIFIINEGVSSIYHLVYHPKILKYSFEKIFFDFVY